MMPTNRFFAVLFSVFSFLSPEPINVINATQEFVTTPMENEKAINYSILVIAKKSSKKLHFEDMLTGNKITGIHIYDPNNTPIESFRKNDTLRIEASMIIDSEIPDIIYLQYTYKDKPKTTHITTETKPTTLKKD